jgi:hypothetical protein
LRAKRIKSDLDHCAKKGLAYHLWWHPHNFGVNLHQNLGILEAILKHFSSLRDQGAMESLSMGELAAKAKRLTDQTRSA